MQNALIALEKLTAFALKKHLIDKEDLPWARNLLLDALKLEAPARTAAYSAYEGDLPATATPLLEALCEDAVARGVLPDEPEAWRELFAARLMGLLTPPPSVIADRFAAMEQHNGVQEATRWFYKLCRDNNYIRVDDIARNEIFTADSPAGELVITINLSKPEKDPKTIALERSLPASGYPLCQLCVENTGYAGRLNFPARQNHRMLPLMLNGRNWHFQYSPYLYYNEHCIVLSDEHSPMKIEGGTFQVMFDFVDRFEHYFIGSNADLPIVGGSILSHDHFQGGRQVFPMTKAPIATPLLCACGVRAGIVDWPLSSIRLKSCNRDSLLHKAVELLEAWRAWSDDALGILARTDAPHNAVTPILRKERGEYVLDLVLRNNRVSQEHPLGIFHPHEDLHHIKRENIGLIEVMGMFILPGRLLGEMEKVQAALCSREAPSWEGDMQKHLPWALAMREKHGIVASVDAQNVLRQELAVECARVLTDCGVYPQSEEGREGMLRFLATIGMTRL